MAASGYSANPTLAFQEADDAAAMPQSQFDGSSILSGDDLPAMAPVRPRETNLADEEDTIAALKLRSTSMPDPHGPKVNRRTASAGPPMPQPSALTIVRPRLSPKPQGSLSFDETELSRAILRGKRKLGEIFDSEMLASVEDMKLARLQRYIIDTRMRLMPHQNSRDDRYLKKAELFSKSVSSIVTLAGKTDHRSDEAARLIWRCLETVLSLKSRVSILERIFSALDEAGDIIQFLGRDRGLQTEASKTSGILVKVLATVLDFCTEIAVSTQSLANLEKIFFFEFESRFRKYINALYEFKIGFLAEVWIPSSELSPPSTSLGIQKIRRWLSGYDRTVFDDYSRLIGGRVSRHEITCDWMTPVMRDFIRGSQDLLLLTGPPGCGKSLAMGSIVDYARINMRQKSFKMLSFSIDSFSPLRRSETHLVKNLLLQLLDQSIGDYDLLHALSVAYESIESKHEPKAESILWEILAATLQKQKTSETLLVIDGIDKIGGGWVVSTNVTTRLQAMMACRRNLRCVVLGRPFEGDVSKTFPRPFSIPDVHAADIKRFIQAYIVKVFATFSLECRKDLLARVLMRTIHSYVEVQLLFSILSREATHEKVLLLLKQIPRGLAGLVGFIYQSLDNSDPQTNSIFGVLLAAQRPLHLDELTKFARLNIDHDIQSGADSYRKLIRKCTGGLIDVSGSQVHFVNSNIRMRVGELFSSNKASLSLSATHDRMAVKCLNFLKDAFRHDSQRPIFQASLDQDAASIFCGKVSNQSHLEYSLRYYLVHYMNSGRQGSGSVLLPADIKAAVPDSVLFPIIERRWWQRQLGTKECERMLQESLALRRAAFGSQAKCVLQTMLELAFIRRKVGNHTASMKLYYDSWVVSTRLYSEHDSFSTAIAETFVSLSSLLEGFESDFTIEVEKIYLYLYRAKQRASGEGEHDALYYGDMLADFYLRLQRMKQACSIRRELFEVLVKTHGALHETTRRYTELYIRILEVLEDHSEIGAVRGVICGAAGTQLAPWDSLRVRITLDLVNSCEARGAFREGEHTLRELWQSLFSVCSGRIDDQIDLSFTTITLRFSRFLKERGNRTESRRVISDVWRDIYSGSLRRRVCPSDGVLVNLRQIGETLLSFEQYDMATEMMTVLRQWYISTGRKTQHEAVLISIALSKCCHHTDRSVDAEDILASLFDTLITAEVVDRTVLDICIQLMAAYEKTSRWHDAIEACTKTLSRIWFGLFDAEDNDIALPGEYSEEAIQLALRLAGFHHRSGSIAKAEHIRFLVYHSCRRSWPIDDQRLLQATIDLCDFYEELGKVDKALEVWRELQGLLFTRFGRQNKIYVQISYRIVRLSKRHSRPDLEDGLRDIILGYGHGHEACDQGSIEAILDLIQLYEQQARVQELRRWYHNLFMAFQSKGHECGLKGDDFFAYYVRYVEFLRKENDEVLAIDIARRFRATCLSMYGARSILSVKALFQLATVLELHPSHLEETIRVYEEICSLRGLAESKVALELIRRARARLTVLYCGSEAYSKKAEHFFIIIWKEAIAMHEYASEQSLECLHQLINFYEQKRHIDAALTTLETAVIEILRHERESSRLFAAARQFSGMYRLIECRIKALDFLTTLRIEFNSGKQGGRLGQVDRQSFVFVLTMEHLLNDADTPTLYTDVLQELMTETLLYEKWTRISTHGDLDSSLSVGAQLLGFLEQKHRIAEIEQITEELWTLFTAETHLTTEKSGFLYEFFTICIKEMKLKKKFELLDTAVSTATHQVCQARYQEAFDLSIFVHDLVVRRGGWAAEGRTSLGFKLATALSGHRKSADTSHQLSKQMEELSLNILSEVLRSTTGLSFEGLSRYQLHLICVLLGQLGAWENLQVVLERLWNTRTRTRWDYDTTIEIGLRLCEARYRAGKVAEALGLLKDIRYNTAEALGPLHPLTLKCDSQRARLYTSAGKFDLAVDVHTSLLRQIRNSQEDGLEEYVYRSDDSVAEGALDLAAVGFEHARLLKTMVQRHGKDCWHNDEGERVELEELLRALKGDFAKNEDHWHDIDPSSLEMWADLGEDIPKTAEFGYWEPPKAWGFLSGSESDDEDDFALPSDSEDEDLIGGIAAGGHIWGFDKHRAHGAHQTQAYAAGSFDFSSDFALASRDAPGWDTDFGLATGAGGTNIGSERFVDHHRDLSFASHSDKRNVVLFEDNTFAADGDEERYSEIGHKSQEESVAGNAALDDSILSINAIEAGMGGSAIPDFAGSGHLGSSASEDAMPSPRYERPAKLGDINVDIAEVSALSDDGEEMPHFMPMARPQMHPEVEG